MTSGSGLLRVQACSIWTIGVIIQCTAGPCPSTLQQMKPGDKSEKVKHLIHFVFPIPTDAIYLKTYHLNQSLLSNFQDILER